MKGSFHSAMQIWFMISEKRYTSLHRGVCMYQKSRQDIQLFKLPLGGLVVFIDMNTTCIYLQNEAGVSKHY